MSNESALNNPFAHLEVVQDDRFAHLEPITDDPFAHLEPIPDADTSPINVESEKLPFWQDPFAPPVEEIPVYANSKEMKLAEQGIDTQTPAPAGLFETGWAYSDRGRAKALEESLGEHFKQDVHTRVTEDGVQWLNPETRRWTTSTKPGLDLADVKENGVTLMTVGAETVAMLPAALTANPAGVIASGSLAAASAEYFRLRMGQAKGYNDDMTDYDMVKSVIIQGGLAAVGGWGADKILKFLKGVDNAVMRRYIPKEAQEAVDALGVTAKDISKIIKEIQSESEHVATPSLGKQADDEKLMGLESRALRQPGDPHHKDFKKLNEENRLAAQDYFDAKSDFGEVPDSSSDFGRGLSQEAARQNQADLDLIGNPLEQAKTQSRILGDAMPESDLVGTGQAVRNAAEQAVSDFKAWSQRAYNVDIPKYASDNGIDLNSYLIPNAHKISEAKDIIGDVKLAERWLGKGVLEKERTVLGPKGEADQLRALFDPNAEMTFQEYRATTSLLKRKIRAAEKFGGEAVGDVTAMKRLLSAIQRDYDDYVSNIGHEGLQKMIRETDQLYKTQHNALKKGLVGELLHKDKDGMWHVRDGQVFRTLFQKDHWENAKLIADHLKDVEGGREAMFAIRKQVLHTYRDQAYIDGKFDPKAHKKFLQDYGEVLQHYFTRKEWDLVNRSGDMAKTVTRLENQMKQTKERLKKTFRTKLAREAVNENTSYHNIFSKVWGEGKVDQVVEVKKILAERPELMQQFKALAADKIRNSLFTQNTVGGLSLNYKNFSKYLDNNKGNIKKLFGEEYFKNLTVLRKYVELANRQGVGTNWSNSGNLLMDVLNTTKRVILGPLSHKGYAISSVAAFKDRSLERNLAQIVMRPALLDEMIKAAHLTNNSIKTARMAGVIYMSELDDELYETPDVVENAMSGAIDSVTGK